MNQEHPYLSVIVDRLCRRFKLTSRPTGHGLEFTDRRDDFVALFMFDNDQTTLEMADDLITKFELKSPRSLKIIWRRFKITTFENLLSAVPQIEPF